MNIVRASTRKTDANLAVVIPSAARHDFSGFINRMQRELLDGGKCPSFFILSPAPFDRKISSNLVKSADRVNLIDGIVPYGERLVLGLDKARRDNDLLVVTCDDFDHLLGSFAGFSRQLGRTGEMQVGAWEREAHTYLPYPLFINEISMSMAVTYANPKHSPSLKPPKPGFDAYLNFKEEAKGAWHQAYIGLMGFASKKWAEVSETLPEIFRDNGEWRNVGIEASVVLAAQHLGFRIGQFEIPKRFEHTLLDKTAGDYESQNQRYRDSRVAQFTSGISLVESYAQRYDESKVGAILELKENALQILQACDFYWPAPNSGWPKPTEWNIPVQTAF